jgi:hypothetical protein
MCSRSYKFQRGPKDTPEEMCYECQDDVVFIPVCRERERERDRAKNLYTLSIGCRRNKYIKLESEYYRPNQL